VWGGGGGVEKSGFRGRKVGDTANEAEQEKIENENYMETMKKYHEQMRENERKSKAWTPI
jgi:predicted transcriptional regulator YheO